MKIQGLRRRDYAVLYTFLLAAGFFLCVAVTFRGGQHGLSPEETLTMKTRTEKRNTERQQQLTPEQYDVLRQKGTERAFTGKYWDHKTKGLYRCAGCGAPLFESGTKYDSGSGWPSFWAPIHTDRVSDQVDRSHGMVRSEVTCARCDGHLGHVFDDGPEPTGLRYCINSAALDFEEKPETEIAVFAAGCFWHVEDAFRKLDGVWSTSVGFTGGTVEDPSYRQVCTDTTGHAEAVRVEFDPGRISYEQLLDVFWSVHDPTTPGRQGPDVGSQYRSAIFTQSEDQQRKAVASRDALQESGRFGRRRIVTQIETAKPFYPAEDYHQQYYDKKRMCGGVGE